ncbi:MAG: WxcM-like domain-containing protein [Nanoarchaeota archaeon]|nr:WxcM-like domain-containing protein [Nanoarchaeota archaeon]
MINGVRTEKAKRVKTNDLEGKDNGFLVELFKDGRLTTVYLSALAQGAFKGYHLHRIRKARYMCVKGTVKIILYKDKEREEYILDSKDPIRLYIPDNVATGLLNMGDEEAWLINFPDPPYDPDLKDEQVEYTEEECEAGIIK